VQIFQRVDINKIRRKIFLENTSQSSEITKFMVKILEKHAAKIP